MAIDAGVGGLIPTGMVDGLLSNISYFGTILIGGILVGGIAWAIWQWKQYNITVEINEKRANSWIVRFDVAKRISKNGVTKYHLRKAKVDIRPPDNFDNIYLSRGGDYLKLIKEGEQYFSFGQITPDGELDPIPMDMEFWRVNIQQELLQRFKNESFWDKYGTTISVLAFAMIFMIGFVVIERDFNATAQMLASTAQAMSNGQVMQAVTP